MDPGSREESGLHGEEIRRRHIVPKAILVGLLAGVLASAFRVALEAAEHARGALVTVLPGVAGDFALVAVAACGSALAAWIVWRIAPNAAGSGIPHVHAVVSGEAEPEWKRLIPVKFVSGVLAIGSGLTLGREGPTVQMGGALGAMVSRVLRVRVGEGERRALVSAGAGAGLAAAFNAPLSGLIFVLEELHGKFTPVMFVAAFLASVSADIVSRLLVDEHPVFHVVGMQAPGVASLPLAAALGVLAGALGVVFNRCLLATMATRARISSAPIWLVAGVLGALVGLACVMFPLLAGSGGALVQVALSGQILAGTALLFLVLRFVMTMLRYGTGAAGGIFAPLLVLGALLGLWFASTMKAWMPGAHVVTPQVFCVLGMGALFTAIVRAPLTGIVLMIELTGDYGFMLPLLTSCLLAYGVAEALGNAPIYESLGRMPATAGRASTADEGRRGGGASGSRRDVVDLG